jgi:DNA (cytosine-5)-methyltransferase 1
MVYELTADQRDRYRATSIRSAARKQHMLSAEHVEDPRPRVKLGHRLNPDDLMPQVAPNGLVALSLFAGGGGLDLGFERAGFEHEAAIEILDICGDTLRLNRPAWDVRSGQVAGDVRSTEFTPFRGVDVVHGGPPCQPFSIAGKQEGANDPRNM